MRDVPVPTLPFAPTAKLPRRATPALPTRPPRRTFRWLRLSLGRQPAELAHAARP